MKSSFCAEFLARGSVWQRGAAALIALVACGFLAPAALAAAPSSAPGSPSAAPSAAATADQGAGSAATTATQTDPTTRQPVQIGDSGEIDATAPADTATPTATSTTSQNAGSTATATQQQPINVVVIVRVDSPGNDGPITQSNITVASSTAANTASTAQGGVGNAASATTQQATPTATATQDAAGNLVVTVRLDSPGKNGAITQTNGAISASNATNTSSTTQQVAAPKPAVRPQARRAGAAASRKLPRQKRQPASVPAPPESSRPQATTTDAEPAATTPHRLAIQKPAPSHRHPAVAQKFHGPTHHSSTLNSITKGAVQALSPFVPNTSPVADASGSENVSRPVLLALLLAAAAAAAAFALRRAPARRQAASSRTR